MPASTGQTARQFSFSGSFQGKLARTLEWVRVLITLTGAGLVVAAILAFQQFLIQLYSAHWQIAFLFALLGLMVALLLGQYPNQASIQTTKVTIRWSALFSLVVTLCGIGVVTCILTTAPPLT